MIDLVGLKKFKATVLYSVPFFLNSSFAYELDFTSDLVGLRKFRVIVLCLTPFNSIKLRFGYGLDLEIDLVALEVFRVVVSYLLSFSSFNIFLRFEDWFGFGD